MTASAWTKDRIERLTTLWKDPKTADQVAHALGDGISRSAVLGKAYRMGLSAGRASTSSKATLPRARTDSKPVPSPPARSKSSDRERERPMEPGRASLLTVGRNQCRWPIGDPRSPGFSLCGRSSVRGAYCGYHAEIAYRPRADPPRTGEGLAGLA